MKYALILLYVSEIITSCQNTKENESTNGSQIKIIVNHELLLKMRTVIKAHMYENVHAHFSTHCAAYQNCL